jgi:hypothetical protein
MADKPFDRTIVNPRERPLSSDINQAQAQLDRTSRFMFERLLGVRSSQVSPVLLPQTGVIGDGFRVVPDSPVALAVDVKAGLGFIFDAADVPVAIDSVVGLDDRQPYKPILLLADTSFSVPTAPGGGQDRTDIVEVRIGRRTENPLSRDVLDLISGQFVPTSVNKTLAFSHDGKTGTVSAPTDSSAELSYKVGVPGTPGAVPATTAGYVKLGEVFVGTSVTTIDRDAIIDRRVLLHPGGLGQGAVRFNFDPTDGTPATPPDVTSLHLPPGVELFVHHDANNFVDLYLIGGELAEFSVLAKILQAGSFVTNTEFQVAKQGAILGAEDGVKDLVAGDVTKIAEPSTGPSNPTLPEGHPAGRANLAAVRQSAGTTGLGSLDNPLTMECQLLWRY